MKISVYLVLVSLIFTGCSNKENNVVVINLEQHNRPTELSIPLNEIAETIRIIPLNTPDSIVIGYISTAKQFQDKLYIIASGKVFAFDKDGKFLNAIGTEGRGPQEYVYPSFIFLRDNSVWVVDDSQKKILQYSSQGVFEDSFSFREKQPLAAEFHMLKNGTFISFTPDMAQPETDMMLAFFDKKGITDSIMHLNPITEKISNQLFLYGEVQFADNKENVRFKHMFNDTIYRIDNYKLVPEFALDLGNRKADSEHRRMSLTNTSYNLFDHMDRVDMYGAGSWYLLFKTNGKPFYYDILKKEVYQWYFELPKDSAIAIDALKRFVPRYIDGNDNLIGWVELAKEDDNPVIIIAKLK